jgi:uncharacterized protein DUF5808
METLSRGRTHRKKTLVREPGILMQKDVYLVSLKPNAPGAVSRWSVSREELERLWAEPRNWGWVYRCALDPRVIVPRRRRWMGWTINFAHPFAWPAFLLSFFIAVGPALLLMRFGLASGSTVIATVIASVCLLVIGSHWEASRPRE